VRSLEGYAISATLGLRARRGIQALALLRERRAWPQAFLSARALGRSRAASDGVAGWLFGVVDPPQVSSLGGVGVRQPISDHASASQPRCTRLWTLSQPASELPAAIRATWIGNEPH